MPAIVENVIIAVLKGLRDSCACIASQRNYFVAKLISVNYATNIQK